MILFPTAKYSVPNSSKTTKAHLAIFNLKMLKIHKNSSKLTIKKITL